MKCSQFGPIKAIALLPAVTMLCSCETEGPGGWGDYFVVKNMTSSPYVAFDTHINSSYDGYYMPKGESCDFSVDGDGGLGGAPDKVWVVVSTRDSVIELIPNMMTDETSYNLFSGIEGYKQDGLMYILDLTDEVLASIADRMRSKGLPPFHIERDEIVNKSSENVTVSLLSGEAVVNKVSLAVGQTVVLPSVGQLFDYSKVEIGTSDGSLVTDDGDFVQVLDNKSYRIDGGTTGYRQFYVTDNALKMLRIMASK